MLCGRQECLLHADIRWILFDAVGTLIYPDPPVVEAYLAVARQFGSRIAVAEIRDRFAAAMQASYCGGGPTSEDKERKRWRQIVNSVITDVPHAIDAVFEELWQHFAQPKHWRAYDDTAPVLSDLCSRGFKIGLASNFDGRLKAIVAGHPSLASCDAVFVSTDLGYSKPDVRFFRAIEQKLGLAPVEIALVGDDEINDFQAATAAGWRAVYLDRQCERPSAIRSLHALLA
jgi:putative hydrolase of the HAD superfamily